MCLWSGSGDANRLVLDSFFGIHGKSLWTAGTNNLWVIGAIDGSLTTTLESDSTIDAVMLQVGDGPSGTLLF